MLPLHDSLFGGEPVSCFTSVVLSLKVVLWFWDTLCSQRGYFRPSFPLVILSCQSCCSLALRVLSFSRILYFMGIHKKREHGHKMGDLEAIHLTDSIKKNSVAEKNEEVLQRGALKRCFVSHRQPINCMETFDKLMTGHPLSLFFFHCLCLRVSLVTCLLPMISRTRRSSWSQETRKTDLHTISDFGVGERIPHESLPHSKKKDWNGSHSLSHRETDQNLVSESKDETQERDSSH